MEKNEKNGVFSRVRSRWRSIFSKKANPVKLRDCNRLTFERILSDPDEQIGTILAQATVEPITLPNGGGYALYQETTVYEEDSVIEDPQTSGRRLRRLSSGDLNVIRRMTEEINFDLKLQNVIYDGNEITGETDEENGNDRACFKPGPAYPTDQQMIFLKQCLKKVETRPPNIYYLTNGWTRENFDAFFKYMIRCSEDCVRDTFLSIEFRNCIVSLESLYRFIEEYAAFKGVVVQTDYVYATVHSKRASWERKLRGAIEPFVEVEDKVRRSRISYTSTFTINSPHTPNVTMIVRFCCQKPCNVVRGRKKRVVSVQIDHVTGSRALQPVSDAQKQEGIACECVDNPSENEEPPAPRAKAPITTIVTNRQMLIEDEEVPVQLSYHIDFVTGESQIDCADTAPKDIEDDGSRTKDINREVRGYVEMFPAILTLFGKAGIKDNDEEEEPKDLPTETSSDDDPEDTQSITGRSANTTMLSSEDSLGSEDPKKEPLPSEEPEEPEHLEKVEIPEKPCPKQD